MIYVFIFALVIATNDNYGQIQPVTSADSVHGLARSPKLVKHPPVAGYSRKSGFVYCSLMDMSGRLWFGTTEDGVYCFDGHSFVNFTAENGLSGNGIYSAFEDNAGNLWFGTEKGFCRFDGKTFQSVTLTANYFDTLSGVNVRHNKKTTGRAVGNILQDRNGKMWFGTPEGIYCYDGRSYTRFIHNDSVLNKGGLTLKNIQCMLEDRNGNIWLGSGMLGGEGVCRYDGKSLISMKPNGDVWIPFMMEDSRGNIWFSGRSNGNFRYNGEAFTDFTESTGSPPFLNQPSPTLCLSGKVGFGPMLENRRGHIWFSGKLKRYGGEGGIWRYDGTACTNFSNGLPDLIISTMVEDKDGNIWVGTEDTKLYRFDGNTFTCFSD